jgi:hypothetical protein
VLRALAPLFAPQVIAFTLVFGAVQAAEAGAFGDRWQPAGEEVAIVWGDRTHSTPDELAEWLDERGRSYATWAKRHPQAAVRLERSAISQARTRAAHSVLPVDTSTLVLLVLVLTSVSLLAASTTAGTLAGGVPRLWRQRRLRLVFWPTGVAAAVLLGLLAARFVP